MTRKVLLAVGFITTLIWFQNCGGPSSSSSKNSDESVGGTSPGRTLASTSSYIKYNGDKIAYVLSVSTDKASLYLPSADRYVDVSVRTGKYQNSYIYFTEPNCQGTSITTYFPGTLGKGIIFSNGKYYRVTQALNTAFTYKSTFVQYDFSIAPYAGGCTSMGTAQAYPSQGYIFEEVDRPYNFEDIAPLDIYHE